MIEHTGIELLLNPGFDDGSNWNLAAVWNIVAGVLRVVGAGATGLAQQVNRLTIGHIYKTQYTMLNRTAGATNLRIGLTQLPNKSTNGTFIQYAKCQGSANFSVALSGANSHLDVDNVSARRSYQDDE